MGGDGARCSSVRPQTRDTCPKLSIPADKGWLAGINALRLRLIRIKLEYQSALQ